MIEISALMFTLVGELLVILSIVLLLWLLFTIKRHQRDRSAVRKLVDQVMHQSATRQQETNSFLHEKYRFEGDQLNQAVLAIDKAEKKFIQRFINIYLKRDAQGLAALDAALAELIDAYKNLSPIMPDTETLESLDKVSEVKEQAARQVEEARQESERLTEELGITKQTMSDMIAEFGNMFGGGADHELAKHEVMKKLHQGNQENQQQAEQAASSDADEKLSVEVTADPTSAQAETQASDQDVAAPDGEQQPREAAAEDAASASEAPQQPEQKPGQIVTENDIEHLLSDIELTAENKN